MMLRRNQPTVVRDHVVGNVAGGSLVGRSRTGAMSQDMTPMVDVTFLLLIFFMVTASFTTQQAIAMPADESERPSLSVSPEWEPSRVRIDVDRRGAFHVLAGDRQWETPSKQHLVGVLKSLLVGGDGGDVSAEVMIDPDARLGWWVDAVDAAATAGYQRVRIIHSEPM